MLKASRFGAFRRSTLSWWRSIRISASSEARDRKSPMTAHQINLNMSPMSRSIARFAANNDQGLMAGSVEFRTEGADQRSCAVMSGAEGAAATRRGPLGG